MNPIEQEVDRIIIEHRDFKKVLEDIASEEWRGPFAEARLKRIIDKACAVVHHPAQSCSPEVHRVYRRTHPA